MFWLNMNEFAVDLPILLSQFLTEKQTKSVKFKMQISKSDL